MAVPSTRADLIPPIGAGAGLPLTLVWADDLSDAGGAGTEGYALFDTTLWKTPSATQVAPAVPTVVSGSSASTPHTTTLDMNDLNFLGLTTALNAPRLNFGTGWLEHGQAIQDAGFSRHSASEIKSFAPAATSTITEAGRHVANPRRTAFNDAARPANHTWQTPRHNTLKRAIPSYDLQIGSVIDVDTGSIGTVEAITHSALTDLPSNGIGATYGDRHNSAYLTTLWSAPIYDTTTPTGLDLSSIVDSDMKAFSAHWGVNMMVNQEVLESGIGLSAPDSLNTAILHGLIDGDTLNLPAETIQTVLVRDIFKDSVTVIDEENTFPLGRCDLGNSMVMDSCGLIGYEGTVTATAFTSVSRCSNPPEVVAPPAHPLVPDTAWNEDGVGTFSAINIQVSSGLPLRRNGLSWSTPHDPLYQYGSDGAYIEPMTEGAITTGIRTPFKGQSFLTNANLTKFHTGRTNHVITGANRNHLDRTQFNEVNVNGPSAPNTKSTCNVASRYILGDNYASGQWTATLNLSQDFMKDKIPTKVKVVPVLIGYKTVNVEAGASHPDSSSIAFKKPIVDYHVIVSLAPTVRLNATVNLNNTRIGNPIARNFPQSKRLTVNTNLEDEGCEIYHAVFRINPTLERVFFDATSPSVAGMGVNASDSSMPNTVMPRHDATNGGWGLHQLTPFRPMANADWAQVPLMCAAIETGGFYQRGGISHLWDADAYGSELFVGADAIDASHFTPDTWGTGQVWADGTGALTLPRGSELMVFKYTPSMDSYHTIRDTSPTDNPLYAMTVLSASADWLNSYQAGSFAVVGNTHKQYSGWHIHDWVFPQVELMRYLGREDKANARHPRHSLNPSGTPIFHPTLHCASLRFMDDGRMAMAAVHRDYIGSTEEYPSSDISYPYNPDSGSGSGCPAGYYRSGSQCIPITSGDNPDGEDNHTDPITGEVIDGPPPAPSNGNGQGHTGGGDNFTLYPSWSRIQANTSGRSLILMWSDAKAQDGRAKGGNALFDAKAIRVDGATYHTQNWTFSDTWWSGSRISYWYGESGQRAIPITYGSYPEVRMSHANLPKCLPHLMTTGIVHGYPLLQPIDRMSIASGTLRDFAGTDVWAQDRYDFLKRTRFVPTTIGFADFGAGANPHQEMGWSGWSFAQGLYDPIGFGNNTIFFSDDPESMNKPDGTAIIPIAQGQWSGFGSSTQFGHMKGPQTAISHHGPLSYGLATTDHPFKADRIWKNVHGGVGYDIPLHLLAPAQVAVRARAGGRNSLDLEMETPFHRTDTLHLDGAALFNTGFDLGGKATPASARTQLGQYYLRSNLWNDDSRDFISKTGGLEAKDRVHGPLIEGDGLEVFWNDHPTEHFHAGAIPLMPSTDYDIAVIENERYAPALLGRIDEISDLDYVAVSEQLQSSVDVHVASSVRPMWDSGAIVSGRGTGMRDNAKNAFVSTQRNEMDGSAIPPAAQAVTDNGLGKGQRVVRTDDGTLHMFNIERSGMLNTNELPVFTHYTKPLNSDMFWNRKAQKVNPSVSTYSGKDEVGPHLNSGEVLRSAAFTSDSEGTIHAVIEITPNGDTKHAMYYTYAKRVLKNYNPHPVYEWDWTVHTPVLLSNPASGYNLRTPTLACDSQDRLHFACRMVSTQSHIIYTTKLAVETTFVSLPTFADDPATWPEGQWSKVNKTLSDPPVIGDNSAGNTSHAVRDCDHPKICLLGNNTPIVFYRGGMAVDSPLFGDRANDAIYCNIGKSVAGSLDPSGRYTFNDAEAIHVVGVQNASQYPSSKVIYYDAIIDERNRAFVTVIKGDVGRTVLVNSFQGDKSFVSQYTQADGLGTTKALFIPKTTAVRPNYQHITTTTNGQGEIHMILGFTLGGDNADYMGATFRDGTTTATVGPMGWPVTPTNASQVAGTPPAGLGVGGGYELPPVGTNAEWAQGGTNNTPLTGSITHFMEVWMPTFEFSQAAGDPDQVIRSINIRWLSVPSMNYDATNGWYPVGSGQSLSGHEDFTHTNPQLRYQRFWGFDAGELDLKWNTNELSWMNTPHGGSKVFYPYSGGSFVTVGEGEITGDGVAGWPL